MTTTENDIVLEPISPELALVDPVLAERARRALPLPHEAFAPREPRVPQPRPADDIGTDAQPDSALPEEWLARARASAGSAAAELRVQQPVRRRRARAVAAVVAAAVVLGAVAAVSVWPRSAPTVEDDAAAPQFEVPSPNVGVAGVRSTGRPDREGARPTLLATIPQRTRTFIWVAVPKATHYRVRFRRGSRLVYQAWPGRARLVIPRNARYRGRRVRFVRGTYHWTVEPGFGARSRPRYDAPIVRSTWRIG